MRFHLPVAIAALLLALAPPAPAAELLPTEGKQSTESPAPGATPEAPGISPDITIEFAPPPLEGTISLGVFDAKGKLVRVLREAADKSDFEVGLNGLIAKWDGKNDAGQTVSNGTYSASGVTVGDLVIEGEAYLGNDWVGADGTPRLSQIRAIAARADGTLTLLAESATGQTELIRASEDGEVTSHTTLPNGDYGDRLASTKDADFVATDTQVLRYDSKSGKPTISPVRGVERMNAAGNQLALATASKVILRHVPSGELIEEIPLERPSDAIALGTEQLVAVVGGNPMLWRDKAWLPLELSALNYAVSVCFSAENTLWLIDTADHRTDVKEYSLDGSFLRHLGIAADAPSPVQIVMTKNGRLLYLLERTEGSERVRGLALVESRPEEGPGAAEVSTWEVALSQSIQNVQTFEAAAPLLEGFKPSDSLEVTLRENPLQPDQPTPTASLQVLARDDRTILALANGLPLREIATTPGLKWSKIGRRSGSKNVTVLQSDGVVIEEFSLHRTANLMQFDAGDFEWPKSKPTPSTEENVPPPAPEEAPTADE